MDWDWGDWDWGDWDWGDLDWGDWGDWGGGLGWGEGLGGLGLGAGGRRDHRHDFVIAGHERCADVAQQISVVHGTQGLGPAVDPGNRHQGSRRFGSLQHPEQELRRQQGHVHRQKNIQRPATRRQRCLDATQGPAPRMKVSNDARMGRQIRTCSRYTRRRRERQGAKLVQSDFEQGPASPWEQRFVLSHTRAAAPSKNEALGHGLHRILPHFPAPLRRSPSG